MQKEKYQQILHSILAAAVFGSFMCYNGAAYAEDIVVDRENAPKTIDGNNVNGFDGKGYEINKTEQDGLSDNYEVKNNLLTVNGVEVKEKTYGVYMHYENKSSQLVSAGKLSSNNNKVEIKENSVLTDLYGNKILQDGANINAGDIESQNNEITIKGATINGSVYGSDLQRLGGFNGSIIGNSNVVDIKDSKILKNIYGSHVINSNCYGDKFTVIKENYIEINNSEIGSENNLAGIYVGYAGYIVSNNVSGIQVTDNNVKIINSEKIYADVYGAYIKTYNTKKLNDDFAIKNQNNNIEIINSTVYGTVRGGSNSSGQNDSETKILTANNNVKINNSNVLENNKKDNDICGGYGYSAGININYAQGKNIKIADVYVDGNSIEILGDSLIEFYNNMSIYGGYGWSRGSQDKSYIFATGDVYVQNNSILIKDNSKIEGNVYGGYAANITRNEGSPIGKIVLENNTITLHGQADVSGANLYGYGYEYKKSISGKDDVEFELSSNAGNSIKNNNLIIDGWSGTANSVNNFNNIEFNNLNWQNGATVLNITEGNDSLANTNVKLNSINGGQDIKAGDYMYVVESNGTLGTNKDLVDKDFNEKIIAGVATQIDGEVTVETNGNVKYTVKGTSVTDQTKLVAENRAVAAAFINQGTDLINDSLDVLSRDGKYGVKTFAAVHGNRSKYDVNSDLKINGWSSIAGVGSEKQTANGDFSWGVFYENGSGNYRTYNEFNNEHFNGSGSLVYNGGGIAARLEKDSGVYTEASLRAGTLKSQMANALKDANGASYGCKSESAYYGAHIGIGKIINIDSQKELDIYGKYFHTYTEGDSFNIAGDKFEFDGIKSDRLRIGARITNNKNSKVSTYYGLAYEYEFSGDAEMRAQGLKAPTQSLQGSSCMIEIGQHFYTSESSPWSFDASLRGYVGERQGISANVQATYNF